jgi:hypothetical protein
MAIWTLWMPRGNLMCGNHSYNHERPHQALGYETPFKVYTSGNENLAPGLVKVDCLCTFR